MRTKSGQEVIAQRKRNGLRILYFLKRDADVEKRLEMTEKTVNVVNGQFPMMFKKNLREIA
jgi:hypothetical protein